MPSSHCGISIAPFFAGDYCHGRTACPFNAPAIGGPDEIQTNQSQLSFSFDFAGSHFAVGNDGHAPVNWLREDLENARARGAKRLFVFDHKQAFTYFFKPGI